MSEEAVKKRLQRAIRAAARSFSEDYEVKRIYDPFFHLRVSLKNNGKTRWIRVALDSISISERSKIKAINNGGIKEIWLRHRGEERFDRHIY
jgi:hypothetical protein